MDLYCKVHVWGGGLKMFQPIWKNISQNGFIFTKKGFLGVEKKTLQTMKSPPAEVRNVRAFFENVPRYWSSVSCHQVLWFRHLLHPEILGENDWVWWKSNIAVSMKITSWTNTTRLNQIWNLWQYNTYWVWVTMILIGHEYHRIKNGCEGCDPLIHTAICFLSWPGYSMWYHGHLRTSASPTPEIPCWFRRGIWCSLLERWA